MNYKKLIKSRDVRIRILQIFSFIPDEWMLRIQYKIKTGRSLNLSNPKRYSEKLQWYKLHYRNPLMAQCVDKYDVREYVERIGLGKYLNRVYGVYKFTKRNRVQNTSHELCIKGHFGGGVETLLSL